MITHRHKLYAVTLPLVGIGIAYGVTLAVASTVLPFSTNTPSATLPDQYRILRIPKTNANKFSLVEDAGVTVLRVDSNDSAGTVALPLSVDPKVTPHLAWRWKINRVVEAADTAKKSGDDYAARVYVFFDVPLESLPFSERMKIRMARVIAGNDVPTAALCYVWDNKTPVGIRHWSPYTTRVHVLTLQSGNTNANTWIDEKHDVAADFRAAFGTAAPRIAGVAVGNDTDQTNESVTTWFGDVSFHAK
ncbi:MAG: DUF3047 domain-containing protein [Burkholderiales bacterium]|jgi:hypothetical protein